MVTHVSLFYLKDPGTADQMIAALEAVDDPSVLTNTVGTNLFPPPPIEGGPDFADVAQIITFADAEGAAAYPAGAAHISLQQKTNHLIARVAGIDFETE